MFQEAEEEHGNCEYLVPAFEWAEAQTMEKDRRNTESQLKRIDTFAGMSYVQFAENSCHMSQITRTIRPLKIHKQKCFQPSLSSFIFSLNSLHINC